MRPAVARHASAKTVLARLRDVLVATADDPAFAQLVALAMRGIPLARHPITPRRTNVDAYLVVLLQRARAGLGGVSDDGTMLAFGVAGEHGLVNVMCTVARDGLTLALVDDDELADPLPFRVRELFLIFEGRRYPVGDRLVIGRSPTAGITIRDGRVSRRHAEVIHRNGSYYLKDLGSTNGVSFGGMGIDNKRIDEGDQFDVGGYVRLWSRCIAGTKAAQSTAMP